jgi:peptidoglycan hydrolase-like protein with peptidoglycan-binding domain
VRPRDRRGLLTVAVVSTAVCGVVALTQSGDGGNEADAMVATTATTPTAATAAPALGLTAPAAAAPAATASTAPASVGATGSTAPPAATGATTAAGTDEATQGQDLDGESLTVEDGCVLEGTSVRAGSTGADVMCVQKALISAGYYTGAASGTFDTATAAAVEAMQTDRKLFVDGVVGRESAISLGVWPDEESFVVRTPPPPAGAMDSMGFPLSSVSSTGDDAPPLPPDSGSGRRLVYERRGQRVWAVDDDGTIIRSWLVSGSKYSNELPGVHQVYSKSEVSTAWNGQAYLPKMVRWLKTDIGHIGFHGIPTHVNDGSPYQTEAELGQRLSGGCQRQANADAAFVWAFADIGTTVVVI